MYMTSVVMNVMGPDSQQQKEGYPLLTHKLTHTEHANTGGKVLQLKIAKLFCL